VLLALAVFAIGIACISLLSLECEAKTITVDDNGEADYERIQDALDAAEVGDTVLVREGRFDEKISIDRTLTLMGAGVGKSIIDGSDDQFVYDTVRIRANDVFLGGFTIIGNRELHPYAGIRVTSNNCIIVNNSIIQSYYSAYIIGEDNTFENNTWSDNERGLVLWNTIDNILYRNNITGAGIEIVGNSPESWDSHSIDTTNTVNGKALYYFTKKTSVLVPPDAGQVILAGCSDMVIEDQEIVNTSIGIAVVFSSNITIRDNDCRIGREYGTGILIHFSDNVIVHSNTCSDFGDGIGVTSSDGVYISNNTCSHSFNGISITGIALVSENITIDGNNCSSNIYGVVIRNSINNVIRKNTLNNNLNYGIYLYEGIFAKLESNAFWGTGFYIPLFSQYEVFMHLSFDQNNTINGKGMYFYFGMNGIHVPSDAGMVFFLNCTNITLENVDLSQSNLPLYILNSSGIRVENTTFGNTTGKGIVLQFSNNCSFVDNIFRNSRGSGIHLQESSGNIISGNSFDNISRSIDLYSSHQNMITGNNCENGADMYLFDSNNNIIRNNNCNNYSKISLKYSNWNTIDGNICSNRSPIFLDYSDNNSITNNICDINSWYGIGLGRSNNNTIVGNTCNDSGWHGIELDSYSLYNVVRDNHCSNMGWYGIKIEYSSEYNVVVGNTYANNGWGNLDVDDVDIIFYDDKPHIMNLGIRNATVGKDYSMLFWAMDDDRRSLNWSIETSADFLNIDGASGLVEGTPRKEDVGNHSVRVEVSDGVNEDTGMFILEVKSGFNDTVWYVNDDAKMGGNGSFDNPFQTIQDAINVSFNGDIIRVMPGYYQEILNVNKSVSLQGSGREQTTISGFGEGGGDMIGISVNDVSISGFTVTDGDTGILLVYVNNITIENSTISWNGEYGIGLVSSDNCTIYGNTVTGNGLYGIYVHDSSGNSIHENLVSENMGEGIRIRSSYENVLVNNTIESNDGSGCMVISADRNIFSGNIIAGNVRGIYFLSGSANNSFTNNHLYGNILYGIYALGNMGDRVNATNNWWGHPTGPYDPVDNPLGRGENISDYVDFNPWLKEGVGGSTGHEGIYWYVDADAPGGGNGSFEHPFRRIQIAIDNAATGDIILVREGVYRENIQVNRSMDIVGIGSGMGGEGEGAEGMEGGDVRRGGMGGESAEGMEGGDVRRGEMGGESAEGMGRGGVSGGGSVIEGINTGSVVRIRAEWVNITGFRIMNGSTGIRVSASNVSIWDNDCSGNGRGIWVEGAESVKIQENVCSFTAFTGIFLENVWNSRILGNNCSDNNNYGIMVTISGSLTLDGNICEGNGVHGIVLEGSDENILMYNIASRNEDTGIFLNFAYVNTIEGSVCDENEYGIQLISSSENTISDNDCARNEYHGIHIENSDDNIIINNRCMENDIGIDVRDYSNWNAIRYNTCDRNAISGISITDRSEHNNVTWNQCNGNDQDGFVLYDADYNNAYHNEFSQNSEYGMDVRLSESAFLVDNTCSGNEAGIVFQTGSKGWIDGNNCSDNAEYGIALLEANGNTLSNNTISGNVISGIFIESNNLIITGNSIIFNTIGIFTQETSGTLVHNNEIQGNREYGVKIDSQVVMSDLSAENNWWGHITGPYHKDENPAGRGDVISDRVRFNPWLESGTEMDLHRTLFVSVDAGPNRTGTEELPFASIQKALSKARRGDTIKVQPGIYYERVVISKMVSLIGSGWNTIIDSQENGNVVTISADGVTIMDFRIQNSSKASGVAGIKLISDNNVVMNIICENNRNGVYPWQSSGNYFSGILSTENTLHGMTFGHLDSNRNTVIDCMFTSNGGSGVYIKEASYNNFTTCLFWNNSLNGMFIQGSRFTVLEDCTFSSNDYGLQFVSSMVTIVESCGFLNNTEAGILMNNSYDCRIRDNMMVENTYGLMVLGISDDNLIERNTFRNNSDFGVMAVDNKFTVDARENRWGNDTGPFHPEKNPLGAGDRVSDNVLFDPWLDFDGGSGKVPDSDEDSDILIMGFLLVILGFLCLLLITLFISVMASQPQDPGSITEKPFPHDQKDDPIDSFVPGEFKR